jgi:ATP-dependent DNA helicase DinG
MSHFERPTLSTDKYNLSDYFSINSHLKKEFSGWKFREGQLQLAQAIDNTINQKRILLAEAGTGTGKTLAYLLPALLSGKKILISTHSKHLQDQLADRDVPALLRALNTTAQVAKLKGRQNYVCVQRLNDALRQGSFIERQHINDLKSIQIAVQQGLVSERGDMPALPEDSPVWQYATARPDQCLGAQCPEIKQCHTAQAKKAAMAADVVVVNHHLLCADIAMRKQGVDAMLPDCDVIVVDEAHQMATAALGFFGQTWSSSTVLEWARTAVSAAGLYTANSNDVRAYAQEIQVAVRDLLFVAPLGRFSLDNIVLANIKSVDTSHVLNMLKQIAQKQDELNQILGAIKDNSPELDNLYQRGVELSHTINTCIEFSINTLEQFADKNTYNNDKNDDKNDAKNDAKNNSTESVSQHNLVFWYERLEHTLRFHITPLNSAMQVGELATTLNKQGTKPWIFVSATLAHANKFNHTQAALGLPEELCDTLIVQSPFNYAKQGRVFIPSSHNFPAPNTSEHAVSVAAHVAEIAGVLGGRTVVLCTSRKAVARVSEALRYTLNQWSSITGQAPIEVLSQLEHGRTAMLAYFRSNSRSVLVGAAALWEGLDLPGNLLNAVVIDKIPFAQPDDPVLAARLRTCEALGESAFNTVQVPEAGLILKQGTGRLIRTEQDWGVISVLDTRLHNTAYGKKLLHCIPEFTPINNLDALLTYCETQLSIQQTSTQTD